MHIFEMKNLEALSKQELKQQKNITLILAAILALAAIMCLLAPLVAAITFTIVVGWMCIFCGIFLAVSTIHSKGIQSNWSFLFNIVVSLAYIFLGHQFISQPGPSIITITFVIGIMFMFAGISKLFVFFSADIPTGKSLILFSSLVELLLAAMLITAGPESPLLLPAILAVQFAFSSLAFFALHKELKKRL